MGVVPATSLSRQQPCTSTIPSEFPGEPVETENHPGPVEEEQDEQGLEDWLCRHCCHMVQVLKHTKYIMFSRSVM
ncbi:hypothetical protein E2C01_013064 [Portunus trituberculatus]|uniref:Uncharacterized protein n=1 Tax=Portunus trituberculatus TaxID=210409 RepID=A0A5B7DFX9_PORTR|nr:hypothetical protein [Portunus trituberculatus]